MNFRRIVLALSFVASFPAPVFGRVDVTLDASSLNALLASMAPDHVDVGLAAGRTLTIRMQDLEVTGFDPTAGPNGGLTTSLRLTVPELGIDIPVAPHLTLEVTTGADGRKSSFLRFDKVVLNLPLTGGIDVAPLLPPLSLMTDTAWIVSSARGKVRVKPQLVDAKTGAKNIRLGFELNVAAAER